MVIFMKLLYLILNKTEKLDETLEALAEAGIKGATIFHSTGMARELSNYGEASFLGSLRAILDPDREENKTIIMVIKEEMVDVAVKTIESVVGDLSNPDTGIIFTVPVDFIKGVNL